MEISIDSIDSLSLVTASEYNNNQINNIQQANEGEQCFKLTLEDGSELTVKASDTLIYQGKETIVQELLQNML